MSGRLGEPITTQLNVLRHEAQSSVGHVTCYASGSCRIFRRDNSVGLSSSRPF